VKEIGFGIIGTGMIASMHMAGIEAVDGARLVAVSDVIEEKAKKAGEEKQIAWYTDYKKMLERPDIDVVSICTPSGLRGQIAIDAAAAGKHIVAEKPLEVTLEKADAMIEACDKAGVKLAVIMQNRFLDGLQSLKQDIEKGAFGRLVLGDSYVKWYRSQSYYDAGGWRGTWALDGGGALMNQAIHYVDLLQWLMGPVESIAGYAATLTRRIEVEDTAVACLKFKSGALGVIEACTSSYPGSSARIEIRGEKGTAIAEDGYLKYRSVEGEEEFRSDSAKASGASDPAAIGCIGHIRQIADMVEAIRENRDPMVDGREARKAVEIILGIYESSKTGKVIRISE